jgi:hypothetical protein
MNNYKTDLKNGKGTKNDADKPMMNLLVPEFIESVGVVLTLGAKKYSADNWKYNLETERIIAALYRHLIAYHKGEKLDPETGVSHLAHIACNAMFLFWYDMEDASQ